MSRLSFIDLVFFLTESEASPKHVGGLSIFEKPKGTGANWVRDFYQELISHDNIQPPFNHVINFRSLGGPSWREAETVDISEHVFYHKPKKALKNEELYSLAASLHEPLMDRSRPLWEFHFIDKVEGGRFAMYTKIHHAYADGVTMSRWLMHSLSSSPDYVPDKAVWEQDTGGSSNSDKTDALGMFKRLAQARNQWGDVLKGVSKLMTQLALEQFGLTKNAVALPFKASEKTPLTGTVTAERQLGMASIDMAKIARMRKTTRCTLNHIALTCIDGALRRYLLDNDIVLDRPISIQMPVNLRDENDKVSGNKIGIVLVDLAPKTDDPYARLREIGFTLRSVRNQIDGVPSIAVSQYTAVLAVLLELFQILGLDKVLPAVSDTLVSNVPGPPMPMYMDGAELVQSLPISTLPPGGQLNITLYSYAGTLYFGLVATKKVTGLANLAHYIEEAFVDLEDAVYDPR
jgi:diacylglycerol O-acyltransferase